MTWPDVIRDLGLATLPAALAVIGARWALRDEIRSSERNVRAQITASEHNMYLEHDRLAINDRREAFVELLAAHSGMAHKAAAQDIDGFLAARQEFDRARARVNLYGPSQPLAVAVVNRMDDYLKDLQEKESRSDT